MVQAQSCYQVSAAIQHQDSRSKCQEGFSHTHSDEALFIANGACLLSLSGTLQHVWPLDRLCVAILSPITQGVNVGGQKFFVILAGTACTLLLLPML